MLVLCGHIRLAEPQTGRTIRFLASTNGGVASGRESPDRTESTATIPWNEYPVWEQGSIMLLICGLAGGTGTTGTLYEPDESPPSYDGAPTVDAPYVWVCDAFYQVESGGQRLETDRGTIRVAFERPTVRGFEKRKRAVAAAKSHIRDQFSRIGVRADPDFHVDTPGAAGHVPATSWSDES